jgi:hypothetical protein
MWCARAAVTVLRWCEELAAVVFLWVELVDLLVDFLCVVDFVDDAEDEEDDELLSCASRRPPGSVKTQARAKTERRSG